MSANPLESEGDVFRLPPSVAQPLFEALRSRGAHIPMRVSEAPETGLIVTLTMDEEDAAWVLPLLIRLIDEARAQENPS